MTTIIKSQIVKQLARFTKNLSPSKISLKFLKGEGELRNLELNETFLTELLELPPFIRLTRAVCNKISAKFHWTRLKTDPIRLFLDCVDVEMEMTENVTEHEVNQTSPRQSTASHQTSKEKPSEYGFVEKVVDGMLVTINSVVMAFKTPTFRATFQMSHLSVHSTDPNWQIASLRNTRIKDGIGKEVLTFKQITFGTLRVDADALYSSSEEEASPSSSPLRVITSSAKLNIVIKKKIQDCSVVSARLHVLLDDVLWVLTHAQLQAVAGFAKSVVQVVEKSKKCEPAPSMASDDSMNAPNTNAQNQKYSPSGAPGPDPTSLFQREDVKETSYRVSTGKIDVHLCDDTPIDKSLLDGHGQTGGSMQIVVNNLSFEHYPYHLAFTSRVHWSSHNEASLTRAQWVQELFSFYKEVMKEDAKKSKRKGSPQKPDTNVSQPNHSFPTHDSRASGKAAVDTNTATRKRSHIYLYECAFVISCDELIIMPVATNEKMNSSSAPFLCSDKKSLYLPRDLPALQFDYTLYFYPGLEDAKVPQPNLFCQLNPLHLTMDNVTCIWFHKFMQSIRSGFIWAEELIAAQGATPRHIDVRIEGLMPKITLPCPSESDCYYKQYRPQAIQIQMSSFRVSNTRIGTEFKQSDLVNTLDKFRQSQLYTQSEVFPNDARDVKPLPQSAWLNDFSVCSGVETIERFLTGVQEDYSENHTSVVWILNARQCWCDFIGVEETGGRPRPFVEPFPLNLCMCYPILTATSQSSNVEYNHQAAGPQFQRDVYASTADRHYHADAPPLIISAGDLSKPGGLSLHRSPSDPYCKQARPHRKDSSTRSTPLSSPRFAKIHKSRSATSVNIPVIQSDLRKVEPITAHPSGSSSLSRSGSEESCESFYADTGVGRAQSHKSKSNLPDASVRNRPSSASSQVYQNTPLTFSISGTDSLSDDSPDRVSESADETLVISTEKDKETALNSDKEPKCALSILLYVPDVLGLKLDHYQFVFLMRLQESIITLRDILFADAERFDGHRRKLREKDRSYSVKTSTEPEGIAVSLVSKGAEVVLLVPAPSEEHVDSRLETEQGRKSHENQFRNSPGTESPGSPEYANGTGAGVVDAVFQTVVDIDQTSLDADNARPEPSDELDDGSAEGQRHPIRTFEVAGEESRVEKSGHERSSSYLPDSKQPYLQSSLGDISSNTHAHRKPCASDPSSVNTSNYGSDASLQTGGSSVASEKSCRGRDVSTVTIHGASLECSLAMNDEDFAFKLLARGCQVDEGYHETLETFLTHKVKKRCKNSDGGSRQAGEIRLRYALGSTVDQTVEGVVEKGLAYVSLTDIVVSLLMSNLDGVLECIQDEANASPPFMPAVVDIKNLKATMESDTPVRLASIPPSLPLDLHVVSGTIKRTAQGHFEATVHPESLASRSDQVCVNVDGLVVDPKEMLDRLRVENNEMASRVSSIMKENYRLTRELEDSKEAKESLENEKERLLVTVARLTDELVRSNREHDEMQNIVRQYQKS